MGAASSVCEIRQDAPATVNGSGPFAAFTIQANVSVQPVLHDPILIPPGSGLLIVSMVAASTLYATMDFEEQPA
jgi:hypothetical protein